MELRRRPWRTECEGAATSWAALSCNVGAFACARRRPQVSVGGKDRAGMQWRVLEVAQDEVR